MVPFVAPTEIANLHYEYGMAHALNGASLVVDVGEFVSLNGPSWSGKSLVHLIATLDR